MSASPATIRAVQQAIGQVEELKRHLRECDPRDPTRVSILSQMRTMKTAINSLRQMIERLDMDDEDLARLLGLMASTCDGLDEALH